MPLEHQALLSGSAKSSGRTFVLATICFKKHFHLQAAVTGITFHVG